MFNKTQPDLLMAALAVERSRYRITSQNATHQFSQSNVIKLTYAQKKKKPANLAQQQLLKQHTSRLRLLLRNAHAVSTGRRTAVKRN